MTLEEAIAGCERIVEAGRKAYEDPDGDILAEIGMALTKKGVEEYHQLAAWLKILKSAKFEYDEAWRILTHPTPDVTSYDKDRAQVILDTFRDSLGRLEC